MKSHKNIIDSQLMYFCADYVAMIIVRCGTRKVSQSLSSLATRQKNMQ